MVNKLNNPSRLVQYWYIAMILAAIGCVAVALSSCATPDPIVKYVNVPAPYPVIEHCKVNVPSKPDLPISHLQENSQSSETIAAYVDTVITLKGAVDTRDKLLNKCITGN